MSVSSAFEVLSKIEAMPKARQDQANIVISFLGIKDWHDVHELEDLLGVEFETTYASTLLQAKKTDQRNVSIYAHTTFDMIADKKKDAQVLACGVVEELSKKGMTYEQIKAKFSDLVS